MLMAKPVFIDRKVDQKIVIGDNIVLTVIDMRRGQVKIGLDAPKDVPIRRAEISRLDHNPKETTQCNHSEQG